MSSRGDRYDVAIVGGGPAGSSLAIRLATAGLKVVVIEKAVFPRPKLCGEFISPECLDHFEELGVLERMRTAGAVELERTVFFARSGKSIEVPSEWFGSGRMMAIGLTRAEMDEQLLRRAAECGAVVIEGAKVAGVSGLSLKVKGGAQEFEIDAKLIVDATGRQRAVGKLVGESTPKATSVAFKTHITGARVPQGDCEIYSYAGGYGGSSRVENGLNNLCFIVQASDARMRKSDPERVLREVVMSNRRAAEAFREATAVEPWLAVPIARYGRSNLVIAPGVIAVGDAAAFIDPFTGSGMLLALQGAAVAAESIKNGFFETGESFDRFARRYSERYSAAFSKRLRTCAVLRHSTSLPWLADAAISVLGRSDILRRQLVKATRAAG